MLSVTTGCHKPVDTIGAAEASIKSTALAAITKQRPELALSELKFSEISIHASSDGNDVIMVTYNLPASAKTITVGKKVSTTTKTIGVRMSKSGNDALVYESSLEETYDNSQR